MDALNNVVYNDDSQIAKLLESEKIFVDLDEPGAREGVLLVIKEL